MTRIRVNTLRLRLLLKHQRVDNPVSQAMVHALCEMDPPPLSGWGSRVGGIAVSPLGWTGRDTLTRVEWSRE